MEKFSKSIIIISAIVVILIIIFGIIGANQILLDEKKLNSYCQSKGWDGAENIKLFDYKCYRDTIHQTGLGTEREYSGVINKN